MTVVRRRLLIALLAIAAFATSGTLPTGLPSSGGLQFWPGVTLWAWERPEDLRGAGTDVGVAFLAATVHLSGARTDVLPRHQPLQHDAGAPVMAVVRIETSRQDPPVLTSALAETLAADLARLQQTTRATALQIDFDATATERAFYAQLLQHVRDTIGTVPLSITALASWCYGDNWLDRLPHGAIDEAVPMLFRMGPFNDGLRDAGIRNTLRASACRNAVGVSTDEPTASLGQQRRVYVFSPTRWTPASMARAVAEARR